MTVEDFIAEIAKNNKGEQEAIEYYFNLMSDAKKLNMPRDFINDVAEIISDEMNHSQKLSGWVVKLSGIKPNVN